MKLATPLSGPARPHRRTPVLAALVLLLSIGLLLPPGGAQAATTVPLGTAGSFAVLANSTITNTGPSVVTGDLGVSPGNSATGFPPGLVLGATHLGDEVALEAQDDLTTAYDVAAGQVPFTNLPAELGGETLTAGTYRLGAAGLTGELTLDGQENPDAVFLFQVDSTLITGSSSMVTVVNGADPCNVFWQVGSSATLGTDTDFVGTVMAMASITLNTGADVRGRVLARTGAVTMDTNTITNAACATPADGDDDTTGGDDTTNGDDDTTGGDDTTNGDDDTTRGDDTTGDDDTTGQIREVPGGGVATGGGGVGIATNGPSLLLAALLVLLTVGGTLGVIGRRRFEG